MTAVALACVTALQGDTEESARWEQQAITSAEELAFPSGPFSAAFVTVYLAWIRMITGDLAEAREFGRRTIEIAERCRFDYFQLLGGQYVLLPEEDAPCDAAALEQYGAGMDLVGHAAFRPTYLGIVALNHYYLGDADSAFRSIGEALATTLTSGELVHRPDLLRRRAEITLAARPERMDEVVRDLVAAVDTGLAQGSLVLALRAADDLARLPEDVRPPDWSDRIRAVARPVPRRLHEPGTRRGPAASRSLSAGSRGDRRSAMVIG